MKYSRRRILRIGPSLAGMGASGCAAPRRTSRATDAIFDSRSQTDSSEYVVTDIVAENLTVPWDLVFSPSDSLYFTERPGRINSLDPDGSLVKLADLDDTAAIDEGGLLGLALHPEFPDIPDLYVYQTYRNDGLQNRILRYCETGTQLQRKDIILDGLPGSPIHDGGRIGFGPDGKLYATIGDSGHPHRAQDRFALAGKVLRLHPDGSFPSGPFGNWPVWSYGHRNSEGMAWHPETNELYLTEFGADAHDEINRIKPGGNYGWPNVSGKVDDPDYVDPVMESGENVWAPAGATFYEGTAVPRWTGSFFFATLGFTPGPGRRRLHQVEIDTGTEPRVNSHTSLLADKFGRLRSVTEGPNGAIYIGTSNRDGRGDPTPADDRIVRVRPKS